MAETGIPDGYAKCPKCGIMRNLKEAPECPICQQKDSSVPRKRTPWDEKASSTPKKFCWNCEKEQPYANRKSESGGYFKVCEVCGENM